MIVFPSRMGGGSGAFDSGRAGGRISTPPFDGDGGARNLNRADNTSGSLWFPASSFEVMAIWYVPGSTGNSGHSSGMINSVFPKTALEMIPGVYSHENAAGSIPLSLLPTWTI